MNLLGKAVNASRKVLGHSTAFDGLNTHPLQSLGEPKRPTKTGLADVFCVTDQRMLCKNSLLYQVIVAVEFATVFQAPGPRKDAGNRIGAGWPPLKVRARIICLHRYRDRWFKTGSADVAVPPFHHSGAV